ncbi:MAG: hypothetical protein DI529_08140 [Chryseobacterium sp.]|nr:MAG: hypothetical protein DI529_08140 [Chryseobacterium sp.]
MRTNLLSKITFFPSNSLKIFSLLFLIFSIGISAQGSLTINRNSFPSGALGYGTTDNWSATTSGSNTITGKADIYSDNGQTTLQMRNTSTPHLYNEVAMPGAITKITITKASGTDRAFIPRLSATAVQTSATATGGTNLSSQTAGTVSWTVDPADNYKYFYLTLGGGAFFASSIVIEYQTSTTSYTVTFNGNGNTGGTMAAQSANTATALTTNTFSKTGYNFGGWASSVANATAGTVAYTDHATYPFSSSTTLYSIWNFGVAYDNNGGTGTIASQTGYYNGTATSGSLTLNNGSGFTRTGYTFGGWKTTAAGTSANYAGSGTYTHSGSSASVTLYAHWVPVTYTLTYNGNDQSSDAGTIPSNVSYTGGQAGVVLENPTTLTKDGYILSSWFSQVDGSQSATSYALGSQYSSTMPSNNITIYARWRFSVAYDSNGGTGSVATQSNYYNGTTGVKSGTLTLSSGSGLTRTGYTFGGWKTSASGTSADYQGGDLYTHSGTNATRTLYAHWILNESTLTATPEVLSGFNYVESHGPSSSQSFTVEGIHLDGSAVNLLPGDNYEISLDNGTTWFNYANAPVPVAYSGTSFTATVLVRLMAGLPAGTYSHPSNNIIAIEGGGDGSGPIVTLQGSVSACLAPTTQSSVSSFGSVAAFGMTVNLTAGNGLGRIVKINTTNSFTDPVSSNALPAANTVYSGSGEQVVYAGAGNSVSVTGLAHSTTYWVRVYEYNICSNNYIYNTTTITNNPRSQATICDVPVNPNGEITPSASPNCGSAVLIYEHGTNQPQSGVTYYWQTSASGTSLTNPVAFTGGSMVSDPYEVATSGYYYVRAYNGNCWSAGSYAMQSQVTISTSANISTQPIDQSVVTGANVSFTVVASGTAPYTYQWQESPTGVAGTWATVGTAATYTINGVTTSRNGYKYRVIVGNACASKISNVVTLTVNVQPVSIWSNEITGTNPGQTAGYYTTGDVKNANITVSGISKGSGITGAVANNRYNASGWTTSSSLDADDYFEFTLTPINGYKINFDSFEYTGQLSSGSSNQAFRSSLDNFATNIGTPTVTGTTINLSDAAYQNVTGPITFRFYVYGVGAASRTYSINDFDFSGNVDVAVSTCTPATITAFPTTGPAGTIVTITGADFDASSTVKFGTADATVEYVSATQLKATVPATADGDIIVDTTLDCDSETAFTLISTDVSGCESLAGGSGSANASDIIIYEIYDENGGNGGIVSLYNRTGAMVDLTGYSIQRASTYGETYTTYANLTGTIASQAVAVIGVSSSTCGYTPTGNGNFGATGFNGNDGFRLVKNSVIIDDVRTPNQIGYYLKRKNEHLSPNTTYTDSEWTTDDIEQGECLTGVVAQPPVIKAAPVVTSQPSYTVNCDVVNASLALTATEGLAGGAGLVYQWYVLGSSGTWTAVSNGGVYSGATSQTLTISDITGLNNYQYYCQVRENTVTCFVATTATQIKEAANTWSSNVWSNGTPVLGSKVIIAGSYNTQTNGALDVCNLTVNSGGSVRVRPDYPVVVKEKIINHSTAANFVVESDANLIQTDNVANEGSITVERRVTGMNNVSTQMDYVYWSSPVSGQIIKGAAGFSPNTPANGYLQYNESNDKFTVTGDATFLTGKGYAIRAETGTNGYTKTYAFAGTPNNGNLQYQNLKWTDNIHGYNLVGNPYPSNIDFDALYALNNGKIYNTAWFWTNINYVSTQMGSGYTGNNYAVYNGSGGVPPAYDWADYDPENPSGITPNGKVKVGQAFIIQTKSGGKDVPLNFNNSMRVADNGTFYQKSGDAKNRFWLTMKSPKNMVNTILIGYITGATNDYETDFDGELFVVGSDSFYSILGAKKLAIQGKANHFSEEDVVTLGNVFADNGNYTIALQTKEGIFENNHTIYLRDKLLNKYINLSNNSDGYTFGATKGTLATRFEIVYKDGTVLGNQELDKSEFLVYRSGENFVLQSSKKIGNVEVYDAGGKLVKQLHSNDKKLNIDSDNLPTGVYIIKAENSGDIRTKKIIK